MHKCTTDAYTVGPLYNVYSPTWCTVDGTGRAVVVVHSVEERERGERERERERGERERGEREREREREREIVFL